MTFVIQDTQADAPGQLPSICVPPRHLNQGKYTRGLLPSACVPSNINTNTRCMDLVSDGILLINICQSMSFYQTLVIVLKITYIYTNLMTQW